MKCLSVLLTLTALLLAHPAAAQTVTSSVNTQTGSSSTSTAGAQSQNNNVVAPGQAINSYGANRISTAPTVFTPSMQPTTPCMTALTGGMSVVGFGLALGGGLEDKECTRREFARVLAQMGFPDAGLAMLCGNVEVRATSPQLCARSDYVSGKPETYVGAEPPVMPPAPVKPSVPKSAPVTGQVGYDQTGQRMIYNGQAWEVEREAAKVLTAPAVQRDPFK